MDFDEFKSAALHTLQHLVRQVAWSADTDPYALAPILVGGTKRALRIDLYAEMLFVQTFGKYHRHRFRDVQILGEERLNDSALDLTGAAGVYALIDAVDGTDLLERRLGNWCSAAVFFEPAAPPGTRILGSFVAVPTVDVYFATADTSGAFVKGTGNEPARKVAGPSGMRSVAGASICFYGQKIGNLLSVYESGFLPRLRQLLDETARNSQEVTTRLYNLAGVPMMMKMVDKTVTAARGIDAVLDIRGQRAHDVVPGAYIALQAGATVCGLDGRPCTSRDLEDLLLRPAAAETRLRYVAAATPELARELCSLIADA